MSEQKPVSPPQEDQNRNRDAEDTRESNATVRPGSRATPATQLPRGGTR